MIDKELKVEMEQITFDDLRFKPWLVLGRRYATAWIDDGPSWVVIVIEDEVKGLYYVKTVCDGLKVEKGLTKEEVNTFLIKHREEILKSGRKYQSIRYCRKYSLLLK